MSVDQCVDQLSECPSVCAWKRKVWGGLGVTVVGGGWLLLLGGCGEVKVMYTSSTKTPWEVAGPKASTSALRT